MRSLLILVATSLLFLGCASDQLPGWPQEVKTQYYLDINPLTKEVACFKFEIISTLPYKLNPNFTEVDILECQGLGGYAPKDMQLVLNWLDDAQKWAKDRRCKLK